MGLSKELVNAVKATVAKQNGVLFASAPAIVGRKVYCGRNILAPNSRFETDADERGYVPVEWWIMSSTVAGNDIPKLDEGLTVLQLDTTETSTVGSESNDSPQSNTIRFLDLLEDEECSKIVLNGYHRSWPLTKILDIGGPGVCPCFLRAAAEAAAASDGREPEEVPPIPCHIHSGPIVNGHIADRCLGKLEAYFFPPVDVPPYNTRFDNVITRLGFRSDVSAADIRAGLDSFGKTDYLYSLMNKFPIVPYEGWTIRPGIAHAPGPYVTFEIQLPQDDFNLLAWQLGKPVPDDRERDELQKTFQQRGLISVDAVFHEALDVEGSQDPSFAQRYRRTSETLAQGPWGRRLRIFFDEFYGEAFELEPMGSYSRDSDGRPFAGIVWSGTGTLNGNQISCDLPSTKEFLVSGNVNASFSNLSSTEKLLIYSVFPYTSSNHSSS